jgi:hypothetical protein
MHPRIAILERIHGVLFVFHPRLQDTHVGANSRCLVRIPSTLTGYTCWSEFTLSCSYSIHAYRIHILERIHVVLFVFHPRLQGTHVGANPRCLVRIPSTLTGYTCWSEFTVSCSYSIHECRILVLELINVSRWYSIHECRIPILEHFNIGLLVGCYCLLITVYPCWS